MAHSSERILPPSIVSRKDIGRLIREIDSIDDSVHQLSLRRPGETVKLPQTSSLMDLLVTPNNLNLLNQEHRDKLKSFLTTIRDTAPVVHMSFSADPSQKFLEKLSAWFRHEVNPITLISIGLQPNIGVGCVIRTTNHYIDMSLKTTFASSSELLNKFINDYSTPAAAAQPAGAAA
jgi:hypothetical protein